MSMLWYIRVPLLGYHSLISCKGYDEGRMIFSGKMIVIVVVVVVVEERKKQACCCDDGGA